MLVKSAISSFSNVKSQCSWIHNISVFSSNFAMQTLLDLNPLTLKVVRLIFSVFWILISFNSVFLGLSGLHSTFGIVVFPGRTLSDLCSDVVLSCTSDWGYSSTAMVSDGGCQLVELFD